MINTTKLKKEDVQKKKQKNRGKPKKNSCHDILQHIIKIAPPPLYNNKTSFQPHPLPMNLKLSDVHCCICSQVLNSPVQLKPCMSLFCSQCLKTHIESSKLNECPVCVDHVLLTTDIKPPEDIHLRLLNGILVKCTACSQSFHLSEMNSHQDLCGTSTDLCLRPHELTATSILSQSMTSPPSIVEQRVASTIVKRMIHQDGDVQIQTGGQVSKAI